MIIEFYIHSLLYSFQHQNYSLIYHIQSLLYLFNVNIQYYIEQWSEQIKYSNEWMLNWIITMKTEKNWTNRIENRGFIDPSMLISQSTHCSHFYMDQSDRLWYISSCLDNRSGEKIKEGRERKGRAKEGKIPLYMKEGERKEKKLYFLFKSYLLWKDLNVNKMMGLNPSKFILSKSFLCLFAIKIRESPSFFSFPSISIYLNKA